MRGRTSYWFAAVACVILHGTGRESKAEAIPPSYPYHYETTGSIGNQGVSGTPIISFNPVTDAPLAGTLSLGEFVVTYPNSGTTTYNNTPFSINFALEGYGSVDFTGVLNGSVDIEGKSSVIATFNNTHAIMLSGPAPAEIEAFFISLAKLNENRSLVLSAPCDNCGVTRVLALATPTPEPATIGFFAAAFGGLALLRRRRKGSGGPPAPRLAT